MESKRVGVVNVACQDMMDMKETRGRHQKETKIGLEDGVERKGVEHVTVVMQGWVREG